MFNNPYIEVGQNQATCTTEARTLLPHAPPPQAELFKVLI